MEMVHFYTMLIIDNGKLTLKSKGYGKFIVQIEFTSDFSNQSDPSDTNVTIHGLSKETAQQFANGVSADLYAGYFNADYTENNVGYVMGGNISNLQPLYNDAGDWQLSFTITDGSNYDNIATIKNRVAKSVRTKASLRGNPKLIKARRNEIDAITKQYENIRHKGGLHRAEEKALNAKEKAAKKAVMTKYKAKANKANKAAAKANSTKKKYEYKAISFKNATGKAIISSIASKAGIKYATLDLVKNKKFKTYTASKKPMQVIKEIANDCNTDVFYEHGKLQIKGYAKGKKLQYLATTETGLITPPQLQSDDGSDDSQSTTNNSKKVKKKKNKANKQSPTIVNANELANGQYQATLAFNADITTGSIFMMKDKMTGFNDWVIVNSGQHSGQPGSTPTTQINFELYSKYKRDQKTKAAQEASAEKKKELAKDKHNRAKAKSARHARTATRQAARGRK